MSASFLAAATTRAVDCEPLEAAPTAPAIAVGTTHAADTKVPEDAVAHARDALEAALAAVEAARSRKPPSPEIML